EQLLRRDTLLVGAKPIQNTTYEFLAYNAACSTQKSINITVVEPFTISAGEDKTICQGDSVQLLATRANLYRWLPSIGLSRDNIQNPWAKPRATQIYTLIAENTIGCQAKDEVQIIVNSPPSFRASTTANRIDCPREPVRLSANFSRAIQYEWQPANLVESSTAESTTALPLETTTFTVTVKDVNGCRASDTVTIFVNNVFQGLVSKDTAICKGSRVELVARGGQSYAWRPKISLDDSTIANPTATPSITTTYTVSIAYANGACTTEKAVKVRVLDLPILELGSDKKLCKGNTLQIIPLRLQNGIRQFRWSPIQGLSSALVANPLAFPQVTTTYTLHITDTNNCVTRDSITIHVKELPAIIDIQDLSGKGNVICLGQSVRWRVLTDIPSRFIWAPSTGVSDIRSEAPILSPQNTVTYTITAIDTNGCESTRSATLTVNPPPTVEVGPDRILCQGDSAQLSVDTPNAFSFVWSPASSLNNPNISTPVARPQQTTTYTVRVTDRNNCQTEAQIRVTVFPLPTIEASEDRTICQGNGVQLSARGSALQFEWQPFRGLSNPFVPNPLATPETTTTYTVIGRSANGCVAKDVVTITVIPKPRLSVSQDTAICRGSSVQLRARGANTYEWRPTESLNQPNIATPLATPTQTTVYTLVASNILGCSTTATVKITVYPLPQVRVSALQTTLCRGENTVLEAVGGRSYQWLPTLGLGAPNSARTVASPERSVTYTVTVENEWGCQSKDSIRINVLQPPSYTLVPTQDTAFCGLQDAKIELKNLIATNIQWYKDNSPIPGATAPIYRIQQEGNYYATFEALGCRFSTPSRNIIVHPLPNVQVGENQKICSGQTQAQLRASGGILYEWRPIQGLNRADIFNPVANPNATTIYTVTVADERGCKASASVKVEVIQPPRLSIETGGRNGFCPRDSLRLQAINANSSIRWFRNNEPLPSLKGDVIWVKSAGEYRFEITIEGCPKPIEADAVSIVQFRAPNVGVNAPVQTVCRTFFATLQATGANTYTWQPSTGLSSTTGAIVRASPATTTTYTVTGRDANGCTAQKEIRVIAFAESVPPLPNITPNTPQRACEGTPINFQLTNTLTEVRYQWQRNAVDIPGANQLDFSALQSGKYRVKVSANNCNTGFTPEVEVEFAPAPRVEVVTTLASCPTCRDGKITITPKGTALPYQYALEGKPFSTNNVIDSLAPGTYKVIVKDVNNCTFSFTVQIKDVVGWGEENLDSRVVIYPNPFQEFIIIDWGEIPVGKPAIQIYDIAGNLIPISIPQITGISDTIPLSNLAPGIYILQVRLGAEVFSYKILKY
ncbi:MAG: T9SS type A sorting domain-containing protein, partial [Bacteroidia bacterium]|nr:T9SS type A sorting domain-containing protein [Bacteroidia bacterium]MDW8157727.1 T9SS type A sorting domain-containing protein [Bacteroidia bacterium]